MVRCVGVPSRLLRYVDTSNKERGVAEIFAGGNICVMCSLGDGTDASQLYCVHGCSSRWCVLLSASYVKASLRPPFVHSLQ
jgi:hypothetical protein